MRITRVLESLEKRLHVAACPSLAVEGANRVRGGTGECAAWVARHGRAHCRRVWYGNKSFLAKHVDNLEQEDLGR